MKPHPIFLPLSWIYGALVWLRNMFFEIGVLKQTRLPVPVISVGNITVGGTGKTPIVKNIAHILIESGKKVAIISRGYGRITKGFCVVSDGENILSSVEEAGDEPLYLAQQLHGAIVIVDEQRVRGSQKAIEQFGAEVILLDDGFQHRYVHRDADIVLIEGISKNHKKTVIASEAKQSSFLAEIRRLLRFACNDNTVFRDAFDSDQSIFETKMLPAGFRREFFSSLQRANVIVVTKTENNKKEIKNIAGRKTFNSSYESIGLKSVFGKFKVTVESLKEKKIVAFCGIAKPDSFRKTLDNIGLEVVKFFSFNDHHRFTDNDLRIIIEESKRNITDFIVTTEKDSVKLKKFEREYSDVPIFVLAMEAKVHPELEWKDWILKQVER